MLTTLEQVKTHLGIAADDTSLDARLAALIQGVDAAIKSDLRRNIEQATYTEFYSGDGSRALRLKQTPVQSITTVYEDSSGLWGQGADAFAAATLLTAGADYALDLDQPDGTSLSGLLYRVGGIWPGRVVRYGNRLTAGYEHGRGNLKITYVGGYATVPYDLALAANQLVGWAMARKDGQQMKSERLDEYSYTMGDLKEALTSVVGAASILAKYRGRKWVVA